MSNGPYLNLGATCSLTEWRARVNFRWLLLRDLPSSQPPSLPKFNFGTTSPTRCTNYSVLQKSYFCFTSFVHLILRWGFKLVDILGSGMETPCDAAHWRRGCTSSRRGGSDGRGARPARRGRTTRKELRARGATRRRRARAQAGGGDRTRSRGCGQRGPSSGP